MLFEWDPQKAAANRSKHGIDFVDAIEIFQGPTLEFPSTKHDEQRWQALGLMSDVIISVVYTMRADRRRIISARKAKRNERKAYYAALSKQS